MVETPAARERLLHAKSEMEFLLAAGPETTIGRRDPVTGIDPDVDLTPVDTQRSISRAATPRSTAAAASSSSPRRSAP